MSETRWIKRPWFAALLVFGLCLAIYLPTAARSTTHLDVDHAGVAAWRLAQTGSVSMQGIDIEEFAEQHHFDPKFIGTAPNGQVVVNRSPGVVAAGVPAYWIAGDAFSATPQALWAAFLTSVALAVLCVALSQRMSSRRAAACSLVVAFTTPVWTICANGLWPHTVTILGIFGMAWAAGRNRWVAVGLAGGVALWGRFHMALAVAVVGLGVALTRRKPSIALRVGLTSSALMALAAIWSRWLYGSWAPTGGYVADEVASRVATGDGKSAWGQVTNQLGMWVAPDRGILVWTPLLLVLAPAVIRCWKDLPDWSRWLMLGGFVYTVGQASYSPFYGGDGLYGYRLGLEFLACAVPAYAFSLPRIGRFARHVIGPVVGLQFAAFSLGAPLDRLALGEGTAWKDNVLVDAALTVPVLWAWLVLWIVIGFLVARVIEDRLARTPGNGAVS